MAKSIPEDEWNEWWDTRVAAIETVLGPCDDIVGHASIPFDIGADNGVGADIIYFMKHVKGVVSVTSELIGRGVRAAFSQRRKKLINSLMSRGKWSKEVIMVALEQAAWTSPRMIHTQIKAVESAMEVQDVEAKTNLHPGIQSLGCQAIVPARYFSW